MSFEIYKSDLMQGELGNGYDRVVQPSDIRHERTISEDSFTATGAKLAHHAPIFEKYRATGYGSIIRATMTLHQVCASSCQYCSTILRNRADAITLDEAKAFVNSLYFEQAELNRSKFPDHNKRYKLRTGSDIRLRGLILSGGGQPNLWPHFREFVDWLGDLNIDLGLITNGFPNRIDETVYERFKWIRLSITPKDASPHYPEGRFDKQYLPSTIRNNSKVTVGYSYVYGPWASDVELLRIEEAISENGFDYCRILADCNLTRQAQLKAHHTLAERLFMLGFIDENGVALKKIFHQLKYHGDEELVIKVLDGGQCYLQTYNVFWDTTGHEQNGYSYCYPCDSVTVLSEESKDKSVNVSERRFNSQKWGLVPNTDIARLYSEPVMPRFDPREICSACLFMRNNETVKKLCQAETLSMQADTSIEHINFP